MDERIREIRAVDRAFNLFMILGAVLIVGILAGLDGCESFCDGVCMERGYIDGAGLHERGEGGRWSCRCVTVEAAPVPVPPPAPAPTPVPACPTPLLPEAPPTLPEAP